MRFVFFFSKLYVRIKKASTHMKSKTSKARKDMLDIVSNAAHSGHLRSAVRTSTRKVQRSKAEIFAYLKATRKERRARKKKMKAQMHQY
jgi:hypothetical protein